MTRRIRILIDKVSDLGGSGSGSATLIANSADLLEKPLLIRTPESTFRKPFLTTFSLWDRMP